MSIVSKVKTYIESDEFIKPIIVMDINDRICSGDIGKYVVLDEVGTMYFDIVSEYIFNLVEMAESGELERLA